MAARSDAATDRVSRTASVPTMTSLTIMGWVKVVNSVSPFFHEMVRFYDGSASSSLILGMTGAAGLTPRTYSSGSTSGVVSATAYSLGQWVFICSSHNGSTAALYHGATPGTQTKVTGTVTVGTPVAFTYFSRAVSDGSEWLDGSLAYCRIYTAVLSDAEIAAESQSATPVRTSNLWADYPFAAAAITDSTANARNLTAGSTALSSDTDPLLGTTQTIAVAATSAVSIVPVETDLQTVTVAATSSASITATPGTSTSIAVAATSAVSLVPVETDFQVVAVAATSACGISLTETEFLTLAVAATSTASIVPVETDLQTVAVAATSAVSLALTETEFLTLAVAATSSASIVAVETDLQVVAVAASSSVSMALTETELLSVAVAATSTAVLGVVETELAAVAVGATSLVTLSFDNVVSLTVAIAATSSVSLASVPGTSAAVAVAATSAVSLAAFEAEQLAVAISAASSVTLVPVSMPQLAVAVQILSAVALGLVEVELLQVAVGITSLVTLAFGTMVHTFKILVGTARETVFIQAGAPQDRIGAATGLAVDHQVVTVGEAF